LLGGRKGSPQVSQNARAGGPDDKNKRNFNRGFCPLGGTKGGVGHGAGRERRCGWWGEKL